MNYGILQKQYDGVTQAGGDRFPWLQQYRKKSWSKFNSLGIPDRTWENWRYLSLRSLNDLVLAPSGSQANSPTSGVEKRLVDLKLDELKESFKISRDRDSDDLNILPIYGVNGQFEVPTQAPANFTFFHLKDLSESPFSQFENTLNPLDGDLSKSEAAKATAVSENPFFSLNSALMTDALIIKVHQSTRHQDRPYLIHLIHGVSTELGTAVFPRVAFIVEKDVQVSLVETYLAMEPEAQYLCTPVTQIILKEKSSLNHLRIQNDSARGIHIGITQKVLSTHSQLASLSLSGTGKIVRHDLSIQLSEQYSHAEFNGLFLVKQDQLVDHHTSVDHSVPFTTSRQLYHGMVGSGGKGIFNGKVCVRPGAHGTDARQTNKNLLLSSDGEINTKPELQIEADDVKCSHGAAIGQVDPIQLHYLKSRGIPETEARKMLLSAFAFDVIERFPIDSKVLKSWIMQQVGEYFL